MALKELNIELGDLEVVDIKSEGGTAWNCVIKYNGQPQHNIEKMIIILDGSKPTPRIFTKIITTGRKNG